MIFKVTHIDAFGKCRLAWVTADSSFDAIDQMDAAFGASAGGQAIRTVPALGGVA